MSVTFLMIGPVPRQDELIQALKTISFNGHTPIEHLVMGALLAKQYNDESVYTEMIQEILDYYDFDQFSVACQQAIELIMNSIEQLTTALEMRLTRQWPMFYELENVAPIKQGFIIKLVKLS